MFHMTVVFAQLERDTIAERIRDNMHELAKTGRWLGGNTPTGYCSESVKSVTVDGKTKKACKLKLIPEEAETVKLIFDLFIKTGSLMLDIALGIGGIPKGRIVEIYGPESSGKTTVALHCVAEAQKAGGTAAFIDVEHALVNANSQNIKIAKNGKFDISFNAATSQFKYTCVEEYSNLTVSIAIDNKAGWSPLRLVLKSGDNFITAPEGDLIEGSSYAVSGDYIGSSLTYQFLTDGKQGEDAQLYVEVKVNKGDKVDILAQLKIGKHTWGYTGKGWIRMDYVKMN